MKKFFTVIPLQSPAAMLYQAADNPVLQLDAPVRFPIMTAVAGCAQPGEEIRVIAVLTDSRVCRENLALFSECVRELCEQKQLSCPRGVEAVFVPEDDSVSAQVATFRELITHVDDNDELFACMTYGTKPTSTVVMMALQYAYRIKSNASISGIVYGQVNRPNPKDESTWQAKVYDMTALVKLDEVVHLLAATKAPNPTEIIDMFLFG
jgi:hypothetical protein